MKSPGIIVIWNDILPESRDDFLAWHSREHIPERVSIPGFVRGQRWYGADAAPQYLTLYTTTDTGVLTSQAYLDRLNNPTPWTRRSVAAFRNTARAAGSLAWESSRGCGGVILTARFDLVPDVANQLVAQLAGGVLDDLVHAAGVARVRLAVSAVSASQLQTAERAVRSGDVREPALTLLVEGFDSASALQRVFQDATSSNDALATARIDLYSLQFDLCAESSKHG